MNIPLNIDFLQVLLHLLNFVILAGGLTFLLYKPVMRFLEQRRQHFAKLEEENRLAAEENQRLRDEYEQKMEAAEAEIEEKQKIAEKEWADVAAQHIDAAKEKAAAILQEAEEDAEERKEHILESAQTEISELVVSAAQKLLAGTASPERNSALYDEFVRLAGQKNAEESQK